MNAARRRFAEEGYKRTTIRGVAAADIAPTMVIRYFCNKEGLFAAAAVFDLALPDLAAMPRREREKRLARHFLQLWEHDAAGGGLAVLLRTAATSDGAAERVRRIFREQVLPAVAAVSPDAPATRAALITNQFLGLAYARYVVRMPELAMLAEDAIVASLGRTIQR